MAFSAKVAEAYCDMLVNDKPWNTGLAKCHASLMKFASTANSRINGINFWPAIRQVKNLSDAFVRMHNNLNQTIRAARILARVLGSMPKIPAGGAAAIRAAGWGPVLAGLGKGLGDMFGKSLAGFGKGMENIFRGFSSRRGGSASIGTGLMAAGWGFAGLMGRTAVLFGRTVGTAFQMAAPYLDYAVTKFGKGLGVATGASLQMFGEGINGIGRIARSVFGPGSVIGKMASVLGQGYAGIGGAILGVTSKLSPKLNFAASVLAGGALLGLDALKRGLGGIGDGLKVIAPRIASAFAAAGNGLGMAVGRVVGGIGKSISAAFSPRVVGAFASAFGVAARGLGFAAMGLSVGLQVARAGANVVGSTMRAVWSMGMGIASRMASMVSSTVSRLAGWAGTGLKFGGIGGIVAGGGSAGFAVNEAMKMESSMTRLQRITGLEGHSLEYLKRQLKDMAGSMAGTSVEDIFSIATMGAKLGIEGGNLRLFTGDMAKFSVVLEDMPLAEATTQIARLLAVFNRGPEDAARFGSALVKLDNVSTASAREILDITQRLSGQMSFLGEAPQKVMALATALRESGIPIETSGTAISQILVRMASSRDSGQYAKLAGMNVKDFQKLLTTSPVAALQKSIGGLSKLDKIGAEQYLDKLHLDGQRVRGTMLQLMQVMPKLGTFIRASESDWNSLSAIQAGYNLESKTTVNQLKLAWSNIKLMGAEIGEGFLPAVRGLATGLGTMSSNIREFFERNKGAIESFSIRVRGVFMQMGTIMKTGGLFKDYIYETLTEKWEQGIYIAKRAFMGLAAFLEDLFKKVTRNIGVNLKNAILDMVPGFAPLLEKMGVNVLDLLNQRERVPAIRPNFALIGNPMAGMPLRNDAQAKLWGRFAAGAQGVLVEAPRRVAGQEIMSMLQRGALQAGKFNFGAAIGRVAQGFNRLNQRPINMRNAQDVRRLRAFRRREAAKAAKAARMMRIQKKLHPGPSVKAKLPVPVAVVGGAAPKADEKDVEKGMASALKPVVSLLANIFGEAKKPKVAAWGP
jgi:TP901 family phage tail tape measure protein